MTTLKEAIEFGEAYVAGKEADVPYHIMKMLCYASKQYLLATGLATGLTTPKEN